MNGALGDLLPLAIGVAISPIPIMAVILMLLSPKAGASSTGFLVGWLLGIIAAVLIFSAIGGVVLGGSSGRESSGWIRIALGVVLILLAMRRWRARPKPDEDPDLPKWLTALDKMTAGRALALGIILAAVNPKNLVLGAAAGVALSTYNLQSGDKVVAIVVYTLIAASTVLLPVLFYRFARDAMQPKLDAAKVWLQHNNSGIMAALLLVFAAVLIGKGIQTT